MWKICGMYLPTVAGLALLLSPSGMLHGHQTSVYSGAIERQIQTTSPDNRISVHSLNGEDSASQIAVKEYAIQVGAFAKKEHAERLRKRIQKAGFRVDIYENLLDGQRLLYLVWVGVYQSEESAQPDLAVIKSKFKIDGVIRPRTIARR